MKENSNNGLSTLSPENKSEFRAIIDYGNKENFRTIVHNILDKGGNINKSIEEIKLLELFLDKEHWKDIINVLLNKTHLTVTDYHVIYEILYSGLFSESDIGLFDKFYEKIWWKTNKSVYIANMIYNSLTNSPFSDYKTKEGINYLLDDLVRSIRETKGKHNDIITVMLKGDHITAKRKKEIVTHCMDSELMHTKDHIIKWLDLGLFNKSDKSYLKDLIKFLFISNNHNYLYHKIIEKVFSLKLFTRNDDPFFISTLHELCRLPADNYKTKSIEHLLLNLSKTKKNKKKLKVLIESHIDYSSKTHVALEILKSGFFGVNDVEYIRGILLTVLPNNNICPMFVETISSIMKLGVFNSEDTEFFRELINSVFDKAKNNFTYIYLLESILLSGAFSNCDEEYLKELVEKSMEHIAIYDSHSYLATKILNTGFLNNKYVKEKSKILSEESVDTDNRTLNTVNFLSSGLLGDSDNEYIRRIFNTSVSQFSTNESVLIITENILSKGLLGEKETTEKTLDVLKVLVHDAGSSSSESYYKHFEVDSFFKNTPLHEEHLPYIINYIETFNTDKGSFPNSKQETLFINIVNKAFSVDSSKVICKEFGELCINTVFFEGTKDPKNIKTTINILKSGIINCLDRKYIKNILLTAIFEVNNNKVVINLIEFIISTHILSKSNILKIIHSICDSVDHSAQFLAMPFLMNALKYKDITPPIHASVHGIKNKYKENFKNYITIKRNITYDLDHERFSNKSVKLTQYLNTIFLNSKKMKELTQFSYDENYNPSLVCKNIHEIGNHPNGMFYGYFIQCVKDCEEIRSYLNIPFPISCENFTEYMGSEEILLGFNADQALKTKAWSKSWFDQKAERKKYLEPIFMEHAQKFGIIPGKGNKAISGYAKNYPQNWEELNSFVTKKVKPSKLATSIFIENKINPSKNFNAIFNFFLKNKKKSLVPFLQKLSFIYENGININISQFKTIDDFKMECGEIDYDLLQNNFEKILEINGKQIEQRQILQFQNSKKTKNNKGLEKILIENLLVYIDKTFLRKFKSKIVTHFKKEFSGLQIDFSKIDETKFNNSLFIESYKMMIGPKHNKKQISQLLYKYLIGEFEETTDLNQYNTEKNKQWLLQNLNAKQTEVWLSQNKKTIVLSESSSKEKENQATLNIQESIKNHIEISINKITEINTYGFEFNTEFKNKGELIKQFNLEIKPLVEEINSTTSNNLLQDLELQVNSIKELDKSKNQTKKTSNLITIEKELDPLKSLMMGNWVNGSCLSFYSNIKNYYSSITNTIDVNKGVYYIKNEKGVLLGRVLVAIDKSNKVSRFKMYYSGSTDLDLNKHFNDYFREIAEKGGFEVNGVQSDIELIEAEKWYPDGILKV